MNTEDLRSLLIDCLLNLDDDEGIDSVQGFNEAGVLSLNTGLVVKSGKKEFQISIVQSR
jgi:hypothetical protein